MSIPHPEWSQARPWFIAEIGVNHDGDPALARDMVCAAAAAGFDAVKFQYWIVEELLAANAPNAEYQGAGDQHELLERLRLNLDDLAALRETAYEEGVAFVVTPDGERACADVVSLQPDALKIGSGDADNPWLQRAALASGLSLIVSTGMMTEPELASLAAQLSQGEDVVFLHCISAYPTSLEEVGLLRIPMLRELTGRPVGFSDHTLGVAAPAAAVALGAVVIEKHVTWSEGAKGPDHAASLPLDDAAAWVVALRSLALGVHTPVPSRAELQNRVVVRKGLYASHGLRKGQRLDARELVPLRPLVDAIPAGDLEAVVNHTLARDVAQGTPLRYRDLER